MRGPSSSMWSSYVGGGSSSILEEDFRDAMLDRDAPSLIYMSPSEPQVEFPDLLNFGDGESENEWF